MTPPPSLQHSHCPERQGQQLDQTYAIACPCVLSLTGVEKVYDLGTLSDYEKNALKAMFPELHSSIEKGINFVKGA
jgi:malate/lactate dehydrogenase